MNPTHWETMVYGFYFCIGWTCAAMLLSIPMAALVILREYSKGDK